MLKRIRFLFEYGAYPVWLYDEEDGVIDTSLPKMLASDVELDNKLYALQDRYNALFIDNEHEFSYVGFKSKAEWAQFIRDWQAVAKELRQKLRGQYPITDDASKQLLREI